MVTYSKIPKWKKHEMMSFSGHEVYFVTLSEIRYSTIMIIQE